MTPRFDTKITRLLGIDLPILQGAMAWLSEAKLVAAVSEAGGLGVLGAATMSVQEFAPHVEQTLRATDKPFAVNFPLVLGEYSEHVSMALSHGIRIFVTSAGSPRKHMAAIKEAGALCLHVAPSLHLAQKAVQSGVDAVILESFEAGGHIANQAITAITNIPLAAAHLDIPFIAAGGIVNGQGLAAALALGADGVQMGTRFLGTQECNAHPRYKALVQQAGEGDAVAFGMQGHPARALSTPVVEKARQMEAEGQGPEAIAGQIRGRAKSAAHQGDEEEGVFYAGSGACLVDDLPSVQTLMARLIEEYDAAVSRLQTLRGASVGSK